MIKLCIFDMGGVMVRDFHIAPELMPYLGYSDASLIGKDSYSFSDISPVISEALNSHSTGDISEEEFWKIYEKETNKKVPESEGSLLGKFFHPVLDQATVDVVNDLKKKGIKVVCGTNVIDIHYKIHNQLHQYDVFDKVYPSHLMRKRKPNPEFWLEILEKEGVKPEEAFFTDDLESNVKASEKLGIHAHVYTDAGPLRKELKRLEVL